MTDQNPSVPAVDAAEETIVPADATATVVEAAPVEVAAPTDAEVSAEEVVAEAAPEVVA
ncbi:MAG: hypothetical protein KBB54_02660 [Candidatus Pacebacteria bacterium]|nr:hypothetical protein [Candidatus Paceibacterota bacterium]MBP9818665.1 hypothetical protein [Candidatus Paceibacterota bacterium]